MHSRSEVAGPNLLQLLADGLNHSLSGERDSFDWVLRTGQDHRVVFLLFALGDQ